jgi:tetratricopeptide (TPR) repeat protein
VVTDGLGILLSPFLTRVHFEALLVGPVIEGGTRLLAEGRTEEALGVFEGALETYPNVILLQAGAARSLVELGRSEEALLRMQAFARQADPDDRPEAEKALEQLRAYINRVR